MNAQPSGGQEGPLHNAPMTRAQIIVIGAALLLAALDGYDVLGMAYAAPAISRAWGLDKAVLGFLLSTSLIGMACGSLLLSPLADVFGRKRLSFAGVGLMIVGSGLSALAHGVPTLAAARILTGFGIGAVVPLTTTIAAEFSNAKGRAFAVTCTTVGFTAGSILGGLVAAALLHAFAWQAIFVSGAVAGLLLLPVIALALPESPSFLIARRGDDALQRLNRVLGRLGHPAVAALPAASTSARMPYKALFSAPYVAMTACFTGVMILVSATSYFLLNWLPQIIADAGFAPSTGSLASAVSSTMGMLSGLAFGLAATRMMPARLGSIAMLGLGCAVVVFGFAPPKLHFLLMSVALCGVFAGGASALFYATIAASFPPQIRASGIGFVTGFGRIFSVMGPVLAGILFKAGLSRAGVSCIFAAMPVIAAILLRVGAWRAGTRAPNGSISPAGREGV